MTRPDPSAAIGQKVLRQGGRFLLRRQAHLTITGAENIPRRGACLLAARHYHHLLDGCALYQATDRPIHILVGLDWAGTGLVRRGMEALCRMVGWPIILRPDALQREPASPERLAEARTLLREGARESIQLLARGELLVMFPEGYPVVDPHAGSPREHADGVLPFQPGVVRILTMAERAMGEQIPVVPVGFAYSRCQDGRWDIAMRIGRAIERPRETSAEELLARTESTVRELSE